MLLFLFKKEKEKKDLKWGVLIPHAAAKLA
jgi:hypothetical protein